jgi:hypothetical protein
MRKNIVLLLSLALLISACGSRKAAVEEGGVCLDDSCLAADAKTPTFADHQSDEPFWGDPSNVDLKSHPRASESRTLLQAASKEGTNFAGHYAIATWSCGAACQTIAMVDLVSGKVYFPDFESALGVGHRADSTLLVINPPGLVRSSLKMIQDSGEMDGGRYDTLYYEWDEGSQSFKLLKRLKPSQIGE